MHLFLNLSYSPQKSTKNNYFSTTLKFGTQKVITFVNFFQVFTHYLCSTHRYKFLFRLLFLAPVRSWLLTKHALAVSCFCQLIFGVEFKCNDSDAKKVLNLARFKHFLLNGLCRAESKIAGLKNFLCLNSILGMSF